MNQQTEKLLRELADKLGTTVEHLWSVLIRQAGISGVTNLIVIAVWLVILVWGYKLVRRKTKRPAKTDENKYPEAEWDDGVNLVAWGAFALAAVFTIMTVGTSAEHIAASLLNPEFWALKELIGK